VPIVDRCWIALDEGREEVSELDAGMKAQSCRSCKALILWTLTERGARMPVDFAPTTDGTIVLEHGRDEKGRRVWRSRVQRTDDRAGVRRKSHYATCPDAKKWRKR
jgi:hypothetical protein